MSGPESTSGSTTSTSGTPSKFNIAHLKSSLKKYGRVGLFTYLGLSTAVTASIFIAIENSVDVPGLLGMKKEDEEQEEKELGFLEHMLSSKGSNLALAFICSKLLVPIKLPAALALTPYVQRAVQRFQAQNIIKSASH